MGDIFNSTLVIIFQKNGSSYQRRPRDFCDQYYVDKVAQPSTLTMLEVGRLEKISSCVSQIPLTGFESLGWPSSRRRKKKRKEKKGSSTSINLQTDLKVSTVAHKP